MLARFARLIAAKHEVVETDGVDSDHSKESRRQIEVMSAEYYKDRITSGIGLVPSSSSMKFKVMHLQPPRGFY